MDVLDNKKGQTNPSSVFDRPSEVVANERLSHDEKTKVLQERELEARLLEVATEEVVNKKSTPKRPIRDRRQHQLELGISHGAENRSFQC